MSTSDELKAAAAKIRVAARGATAGPWKATPVWSPDAAVTSAVYSHAHPTGTPESEVVASGQKRYPKGGLRNPCNALWIAMANPDLAEPLAALLEHFASRYERMSEMFGAPAGGPSERLAAGKPELHADFALAVARAINKDLS
ncbi:hypothetical protein ITP53_16790 [Nonomuraea sp. K274]|uniref:Uncharacterized protein n=1 Tax=Nonomuraea cypriaca TaxID=1187855 RepID=A0A931AC85_9ACTN|nr:hypothetical protein [Nonomuraea cypriaca]MBF8187360.1 hypothetical protein [Nonomuraea cypriaca]